MENAKKKHTGSNILIILLILIILASTGVGLYSWAKYRTTVEGTATGEVAKWNFNVTDGNSQTEAIDFTLTRTDNNDSVVDGKLAPGTCGELEIGIDATGTETALTYIIEGEMSNLPTNLKLYSNEERTEELIVVNNKFSKGGYMSLQEIGARKEKIYWEWPFETGTTTEEKTANNKIDTEDSEKTMNMNITVTGRQVNGEPRLADLVQIGDYVNYDASSNGPYKFTTDDCANILKSDEVNTGNITINNSEIISTDEKFNDEAKAQWRVLSVDRQTGKIDLIATDPTVQTVAISGGKGFVHAETVLNSIGATYGHGKGASSGRSIKLEDVEQYSSYDKTTYKNDYSSNKTVGGTKTYTSGNFYKGKTDEEGNVIDYESITTAAPVTMTQTAYYYNALDYFSNLTIYNMIFKNSTNISNYKSIYWLASRCVNLGSNTCDSRVCRIDNASVSNYAVYHSDGNTGSRIFSVLPVVSLNTNIQTIGQDSNGVWQLKVE